VTKSELIEQLAKKQPHLALQDVELAVKCMLEQMSRYLWQKRSRTKKGLIFSN
jgi:integration host factor subunit beta